MSGWQIYFAFMAFLCAVDTVAALTLEGFPSGGVSFFATFSALILCRHRDPFA